MQPQQKDQEKTEQFEHVIRYDDGIIADFVLASCSVPVNYDYTRLKVETRALVGGGQRDYADTGDGNSPSFFLRTAITVCAVSGTVDYSLIPR